MQQRVRRPGERPGHLGQALLHVVHAGDHLVAHHGAEAFDEQVPLAPVAGLEHLGGPVDRPDVVDLVGDAGHPVAGVEAGQHLEGDDRVVERSAGHLRRRSGIGDVLDHQQVSASALLGELQEPVGQPLHATDGKLLEQPQRRRRDPWRRIRIEHTVMEGRHGKAELVGEVGVDVDLALVAAEALAERPVGGVGGRDLHHDRRREMVALGVPGQSATLQLADEADARADLGRLHRRHPGAAVVGSERIAEPVGGQLVGALGMWGRARAARRAAYRSLTVAIACPPRQWTVVADGTPGSGPRELGHDRCEIVEQPGAHRDIGDAVALASFDEPLADLDLPSRSGRGGVRPSPRRSCRSPGPWRRRWPRCGR